MKGSRAICRTRVAKGQYAQESANGLELKSKPGCNRLGVFLQYPLFRIIALRNCSQKCLLDPDLT